MFFFQTFFENPITNSSKGSFRKNGQISSEVAEKVFGSFPSWNSEMFPGLASNIHPSSSFRYSSIDFFRSTLCNYTKNGNTLQGFPEGISKRDPR